MRLFFTRIGLAIAVSILIPKKLYSQDISNIFEQKPLVFSGSFNVNQLATYRNVSYASSNPYSIFVSGNASFSLYGIAFPFSFSYSNHQVNYSQPFNFNQFGTQPSYKWIKTYIGYNSMSFSPYSLNGHQFLGGGIELTPPNTGLKFSLMYGRLVKKVVWNPEKPSILPYYQRFGYATKLAYSGKVGDYEITFFKAYDKKNSLDFIPDSLSIAPQENMVYTAKFGRTIVDKIKISGTYAGSALTRDIRQSENAIQINNRGFFLIKPNATTSYSYAVKGSADYLGTGYTLGISYERIQPNYTTLGAYYNTNDIENIAITFSKQLMQGKLNIAGSAGSQKNNLDKSKITTSNQFLGSINLSFTPVQRINISSTYSNYSFYTYMRTPFDQLNTTNPYKNLDTLNFIQISQSASVNSSIVLGALDNKNKRKLLMISLSYQHSDNRQVGMGTLGSSFFYQGNIAYTYSLTPINLSLTSSLLGSYNYMPNIPHQLMIGPVLGIGKSFYDKKFTTSTSIAYNLSMKDDDYTGGVYSIRIGGGYSHQKVHRLNFNMAFIYKDNETDIINNNSYEFTGNIGYTFSFDKK